MRTLSALVLFVLGIAGFFLVPVALEGLAAPESDSAARPELRPYQVRTPEGQAIGWLKVTYPDAIRENEERQLDVKYVGDRGAWGRVKDIAAMSVSIQAANLGLFPEPYEYRFDLPRIALTGEDSHSWTVSPRREGDYRLLLRFNVEPTSFNALPVAVNGVDLTSANGETLLPVRVNTRYNVPQVWIDGLRTIGYLLSFILTLPLLKTIFERYLRRGQARA